jgi:putative copper export protein/methionine-rich copper-binding protein CopC
LHYDQSVTDLSHESMIKRLIGAATLSLLFLLPAGSVSAHAKLVRANPAPGSVLAESPAHLQLWFDEEIEAQFSEVQVLDRARARLDTGQLQLASDDPKSLVVPLKPAGSGTYAVVWKVLSATDGHITRGVFAFSVGEVAGPTIPMVNAEAGATELSPVAAITRWTNLLSLLALVGGFFFRIFLLDRSLEFVRAQLTPLYPPFVRGEAAVSSSYVREQVATSPPSTCAEGAASSPLQVGIWGGIESRWRQLAAFALILAFAANLVELLLQANLIADAISLQSVADVLFDTRFGALLIVRMLLLIVVGTILFAKTRRARLIIPTVSFVSVLALFLVANSLALTRGFFLERLFSTQGLTTAQQMYLYLHHLGLFAPFVLFFGIAFYQKYNLRGLLPILGALALLTRALGSHGAAAQGDLSLAVVSDWLHLLAVSVWVGGLFCFAFLMPPVWRALEPALRGRWMARLVSQFSIVALVATAVVALTGLYNSVLEIPTLDALLKTLYGGTLTIKVALFVVMIAFGAVNLLILSPRFRRSLTRPGESARLFTRLRLSVGAEVLLGLSAILLGGLLTIEPPARSEAAPIAPTPAPFPLSTGAEPGGEGRIEIVPDIVPSSAYKVGPDAPPYRFQRSEVGAAPYINIDISERRVPWRR